MNNISIVGRIGFVSEMRNTGTQSVINFSVATDNPGKNSDGEKYPPTWFEIALFGKQADDIGQYLQKGGLVSVTGKAGLKLSKDAKYPAKLTIFVPYVQLLGGNKNNAEREAGDESEDAGF